MSLEVGTAGEATAFGVVNPESVVAVTVMVTTFVVVTVITEGAAQLVTAGCGTP